MTMETSSTHGFVRLAQALAPQWRVDVLGRVTTEAFCTANLEETITVEMILASSTYRSHLGYPDLAAWPCPNRTNHRE